MAGVGQQGQRVGEDAAHRLGDKHRDVDPQRHPHPPPAIVAPRLQRVSAEALAMLPVVVRVHVPSLEPPPGPPGQAGTGSLVDSAIALVATSEPN